MAKSIVQKIVSRGLQDIMTQRLNSDFTAYIGEPIVWQGETSLVFAPTREVTVLASGNNPAWDSIEGPTIGDVELKLYGIPLDKMTELLSVKYSVADGVCVGDTDDQSVYIGLSADKLVKSDDAQSRNKLMLYKVKFNLPEISSKTIAETDTAVADVTLKGKAYPVFYHKANGESGSRTYSIVNSVLNPAKYLANSDAIVFPEEMTPDASKQSEVGV